jgi:hypothetical protein
MAYVAAADLTLKSKKSWAQGLLLTEAEGDVTFVDSVIADIELQVNQMLEDDFAPEAGDADVTLELSGSGTSRLYLPRRCRLITTVKTRADTGTLTTEAAISYRLHSSLNAAGTAMVDNSHFDWIDIIQPLSVGSSWPEGWQTVQVVGKFGWTSPPNDIKRLVTLLVYDTIKEKNSNLRRTEKLQTDQNSFIFVNPDPDETGIPEADRIIRRYRRSPLMVA